MGAMVSPHFSLTEMTRTSTGLANVPHGVAEDNLKRLCEAILEPARALWGGRSVVIHSGYRSPEVNFQVHGHPQSAHLFGRAADLHVDGMDTRTAFDLLAESALPYDKLFLERKGGSTWIHVQIAEVGNAPRRIASIIDVLG